MSMQELMQAFGMFKQSVQETATTNAVNDASQAMQQIKTNVTDQAQQRQQLQGLSDQVALRLTGIGAPASTIEQAFKSIAPQQFGSAEQMQLEGNLSGNKFYQQQAKGMMGDRTKAAQGMEMFKHKLDLERDAQKFQKDLIVAQVTAGGKKKENLQPKMYGMNAVDADLSFANKEEMVKFREGTAKMGSAAMIIKAMEDMVEEHGTQSWAVGSSSKMMAGQYKNLLLQLKEVKQLGVLQKIDVDTMEQTVPNPTNFMTNQSWKDQMNAFKQQLADDFGLSAKMRGYEIDDTFAEQLGLGKQLGAVPSQAKEQMPQALLQLFKDAKEWRHVDPTAAADYEGFMKQFYGQ